MDCQLLIIPTGVTVYIDLNDVGSHDTESIVSAAAASCLQTAAITCTMQSL